MGPLGAAVIAVALTAAGAHAASIGVNFNSSEGSGTGSIATKTPPIAGVVPQSNWHDTTGASGTISAGSVIDSTGAVAPGVSFAWAATNTSGHGTVPMPPATGHQALMAGNLDPRNGTGSGTAVITVTGLGTSYTAASYDVLVYFDGNSNTDHRTAHFRLDLDGDLVTTTSDVIDIYGVDRAGVHFEATQTYVQGMLTSNTTVADFNGTNPLPPSSNYVRFTGLSSPNFVVTSLTDGAAAVAATGAISNTRRSNVQGVQIVAAPEPAAAALLFVAGLALDAFRRRSSNALGWS
jgi:hypothetical protein